jgi:predicted membrane channel-forming protein YqfA (hemolysin III family)
VADGENRGEQLDRELIELLNELRVALPGVQVLFAFLLAVPFTQRFERLTGVQEDVFFAAFLCTAVATALLIAPSAYHRLRWREHDKEQMLQTSNRLAIAGTVFLAAAIIAVVYLVTDLIFGLGATLVATLLATILFGWLWYGLPLVRRLRGRQPS